MNAELDGTGNGVLVGSEEEEVPLIFVRLMADAFLDVLNLKMSGGVFLAIGEDGDDDTGRALLGGEGGEALAEFVNATADGIEQGGAAARDVAGGIEREDFAEREGEIGSFVLIVKEDEGEAGGIWLGGLFAEEAVEASNGGGGHGLHGAGAIKDEKDFSVFWGHGGEILDFRLGISDWGLGIIGPIDL